MKTTSKFRKEFFILLLGFLCMSCLTNVEEDTIPDDNTIDPCATTSFATNVKPIIDNNCIQCHNGGQFPDLRTFANISANATRVKNQVSSRSMPVGGSLTNAEIEAIVCWVENGTPNN
jgi:uncharacterized membrane protein